MYYNIVFFLSFLGYKTEWPSKIEKITCTIYHKKYHILEFGAIINGSFMEKEMFFQIRLAI